MDDDLLMGRFRLEERLGSGGMGVVYCAFDERLQRRVAVKEIAAGDPDRVLREAQAAARLNHPGIATVYELGRRGSSALLVSELVRGATLADLRERRELSDREVATIGADLCEALEHAHANGVVHRDLKPQNVIVGEGEGGRRAKLLDFGIARLAGEPSLTATGEVVGTLAYMSPEQSEGLAAGPPSDTYSLALTLYECWAGVNPVAGPTPAATARRIGAPLPPLAASRPDLDPGIALAIDACLDPDPELRPAIADLRAALWAGESSLDPARAVPGPGRPATDSPRSALGRVLALVGVGGAVATLAFAAGLPGAALILAALALPSALLLGRGGAAVQAIALPLGLAGGLLAYPAAAAHTGSGALQRALAGALGAAWALVATIAIGAAPGSAIADRPPTGWEASAGDAATGLLVPLAAPEVLGAVALCAAAAVALGWILVLRRIVLVAFGTLIWAACLTASAGALASPALVAAPALAAMAGCAAVLVERARRGRENPPLRPPATAPRPGEPTAAAPAAARPELEPVSSH